jgi:hypothetical protein
MYAEIKIMFTDIYSVCGFYVRISVFFSDTLLRQSLYTRVICSLACLSHVQLRSIYKVVHLLLSVEVANPSQALCDPYTWAMFPFSILKKSFQ